MEGPHGSETTPEKTVGWLWGFLCGSIFSTIASSSCVLMASQGAHNENLH